VPPGRTDSVSAQAPTEASAQTKLVENEATTETGRDALGYYHERRDENRNVGLGPEHDWSSHAQGAGTLITMARMISHRSASSGPLHRSTDVAAPTSNTHLLCATEFRHADAGRCAEGI
jgi:hypothetical protein